MSFSITADLMDLRHSAAGCCIMSHRYSSCRSGFYQRDAMLARVFATATCLSVRLTHAGIVPSRAKAGS